MDGEKDLNKILKTMSPKLQLGDYVFCSVVDTNAIPSNEIIMLFREEEGATIILKKESADILGLTYSFVASWITLTVQSSLQAVGFTAAFASALTKEEISCNVIAAYHHDHIFVDKENAEKALKVLRKLSES